MKGRFYLKSYGERRMWWVAGKYDGVGLLPWELSINFNDTSYQSPIRRFLFTFHSWELPRGEIQSTVGGWLFWPYGELTVIGRK